MDSSPSNQQIRHKIQQLIPTLDLQATGIKKFVKILSNEFGVDLKCRKDFITKTVTDIITSATKDDKNNDDDTNEDEYEDGDDEGENDESMKEENDKKSKKSNLKAKSSHQLSDGKGLAAQKKISEKLAKFLGKGNKMSRTEIVKSLWEYIRDNNLQNPNNKREILLDDAMKKVFECDTFTMFTMNKYIGAHIDPFTPVDLTTNSTKAKPSKRKANTKDKGTKKGKIKKKRKTGSQPPYRLSAALQAVVLEPILPRPQVVSKIWAYIREKNLQNESNKREILCDDKLKLIMKKSKVTMFEMNALISPHLIEKVDKSEYQHKEDDKSEEKNASSEELDSMNDDSDDSESG